MDWDSANFKDERRAKLNELVKMADYRKHEGEFSGYRFVGKIKPTQIVRLPIYKDGKPLFSEKIGKNVEIPFYVTNFDYMTGKTIEGKTCPFLEAAEFMSRYLSKPIRVQDVKLVQAINRALQEDQSDDQGRFRRKGQPSQKEKSTGFKDSINSPCRTPVEIHTIGYMLQQDVQAVIETNIIRGKKDGKLIEKRFSPADPKFGCDVLIKYDKAIKANKKTLMQKGTNVALTEDEKTFLLWDLDKAIAQLVLSPSEAKAEATRLVNEFKKSLKNGGKAAADPDLSDVPDDVSGLDLEDSTPQTQTRRVQGNRPRPQQAKSADDEPFDLDDTADSGSAGAGDDADALFGDDNGLDLGDDNALDLGDDDDGGLNFT